MWLQVIQIVNFTIQLISSLVPISIEHARFATICDSESFWSLLAKQAVTNVLNVS